MRRNFPQRYILLNILVALSPQCARADDWTTESSQAVAVQETVQPTELNSNDFTTDATSTPMAEGRYCEPTLCELFNGTHLYTVPHVGCGNDGAFDASCGAQPQLLHMNERRRNLILDIHNLARSRIASGQLEGYEPAAHMPQLKWDNELEYLASLHVKRCKFAHDQCRNTELYQYSGQNIGIFWIQGKFKSHSKRMKSFIINWFREYRDANQSFIDQYEPHPDGKKIGHFTMLVADRAHRVGCAAVRFQSPEQIDVMKFLMTCNYDFNNIIDDPIYETGPTASKCVYRISEKFPALCDWQEAAYTYDSSKSFEDNNLLDNNISI